VLPRDARRDIGRPALNENLNPLKRYLHAQVGRPWNKVYAEIAARIRPPQYRPATRLPAHRRLHRVQWRGVTGISST
jgi:hypothetical protein